jgi:hypothetical protein
MEPTFIKEVMFWVLLVPFGIFMWGSVIGIIVLLYRALTDRNGS